MPNIVISNVILDNDTVLINSPIGGYVYYDPDNASQMDRTITITLVQGTTVIETKTNIDARDHFEFTPVTTPGDYQIVALGNNKFPVDLKVVTALSIIRIEDAGFIPITSVGANGTGLTNLAGTGKKFRVGVSLIKAPGQNYPVTLKLGFTDNGTGNLTLVELLSQHFILSTICAQTPSVQLTIAPTSKSANAFFEVDLEPSHFLNWTFVVIAVPGQLTGSTTYKPIAESKTLH